MNMTLKNPIEYFSGLGMRPFVIIFIFQKRNLDCKFLVVINSIMNIITLFISFQQLVENSTILTHENLKLVKL